MTKNLSLWSTKLLVVFAIMLCIKYDGMGPKELHQYFLESSPVKVTKHLGKLERFKDGLPPDRFNEEIYDLTMNPSTGAPDYQSGNMQYNIEVESNQTYLWRVVTLDQTGNTSDSGTYGFRVN